MKKITYSLIATAFVLLSGCQDDVDEQPGVPVQTGDEISFGSSLSDTGMSTRTIYDDTPTVGPDGQKYYRVSWEEDGSDEIAIYCPQANVPGSPDRLVNYKIIPDTNNPTTSSAVTKVNPDDAGLQWGEGDGPNGTHRFYGFYPASAVTGTEDGKIKGHIPELQNPTGWRVESNDAGGTTYYGQANTDYAYMWAYGSIDKNNMTEGEDVALTFHPWTTILEIEVNGPESGTIKVSNINVNAIGGQTLLNGDFVCDMTKVEDDPNAAPSYEAVGNTTGLVRNKISISGWNAEKNDFITLGPNDKMIVRAFLLPVDEGITDAQTLQISVSPLNRKNLVRTLGGDASAVGGVKAHKVNIVKLPALMDLGTNYWISSLDPDIYLSELSLPGSKFSYLTAKNNAEPVYQGTGIDQQFIDGVRAFIVQTGATATYECIRSGSWLNYKYDYDNYQDDGTLPIFGASANLESTLELIASALTKAETELQKNGQTSHEFAVVMVTYADNGQVHVTFTGNPEWGAGVDKITGGAERVWMDVIADRLSVLGTDVKNRIYTEEITANTKINDVKGKIILKVNYNSNLQENYVAADASVPALFSMWDGTINTVPLRWGTPNSSSSRKALQWMYQEATHVGEGQEITKANKEKYVYEIFDKSVAAYQQNDAHDTWYMNDCGGTFYEGTETNEGVIGLTEWLNPLVISKLQERTENASLGLIFFNFADSQSDSGQKYGTDGLIQTVIDNNFKFQLRKEGSSSQTNNYNSTYTSGGNIIE